MKHYFLSLKVDMDEFAKWITDNGIECNANYSCSAAEIGAANVYLAHEKDKTAFILKYGDMIIE